MRKVDPLHFRVLGLPAPQGSKKIIQGKYQKFPSLVESSKKVKPWRMAVAAAAQNAIAGTDFEMIDGPVSLTIVFFMPGPKSPKWKMAGGLPDRRPDLDKLARSTLDAMSGRIYKDDACVVDLSLYKRYGLPLGASITCERMIERGRPTMKKAK